MNGLPEAQSIRARGVITDAFARPLAGVALPHPGPVVRREEMKHALVQRHGTVDHRPLLHTKTHSGLETVVHGT